jgi:hypothetical protein
MSFPKDSSSVQEAVFVIRLCQFTALRMHFSSLGCPLFVSRFKIVYEKGWVIPAAESVNPSLP